MVRFSPYMTPHILFKVCGVIISMALYHRVETISHHHLREFVINPDTISILSFSFEAKPRPPDWFHRILGKEAVFFRKISEYSDRHYGMNHITRGKKNFQDSMYFEVPEYAYWPECSIEMLGFVRIGSAEPFRGKGSHDREKLAAGRATLTLVSGQFTGMSIMCMYRALYENWREDDYNSTFYTVPIYCPVEPGMNKCRRFQTAFYAHHVWNSSDDTINATFQFEMTLPSFTMERGRVRRVQQQRVWSMELEVYRDSQFRPTLTGSIIRERPHQSIAGHTLSNASNETSLYNATSPAGVDSLPFPPQFAVCTAQVYLTSDDAKIPVNQALTFEFVRYYALLGFKVMLYDRAGATSRGAFDTPYARLHWPKGKYANAINESFDKHDWTVHGLLNLEDEEEIIRSDMQEQSGLPEEERRSWRHKTADWRSDKGLTYSHCRFEAKAKYGITNVVVVDFDEFLYCKDAPATLEGQSAYIERLFSVLMSEQREQVMFGKTSIASKAAPGSTMKECVTAEVKKAESYDASAAAAVAGPAPSVFNCLSSIQYIDNVPFIKSIHLGHFCPMTSRHSACAPCSENEPRCYPLRQNFKYYDCICDSIRLLGVCDFVHLSLVEEEYHTDLVRSRVDAGAILASSSELLSVVNTAD